MRRFVAAAIGVAAMAAPVAIAAEAVPRTEALTLEVRLGGALVELYCSGCHATGREGTSPHEAAPPFRELHLRYPVEDLMEALVEGLVSGHPDMPEYEFEPVEAAAIVAYLKGLE